MVMTTHRPSRDTSRMRFALGMGQMAAAVVAAVLLLRTGVSAAALGAVVVTCTLSTLSVMLFGSHRRGTSEASTSAHARSRE